MTDTTRRGHTTLAALLADPRFADIPGAGPHDQQPEPDRPTPEQDAAFNRQRALRCIDLWTPPAFRQARADHPDVVGWAQRYIADPATAGSLLLLGRTGCGKTHQAYGALRLIAESGRPPIAWRAVGAADLYAQLRGRSGDETQQTFDAYANRHVLLLDDLGAAKDTQFTEEITYRLVNHRYQNNLPLIVTSNLTPKNLGEGLGERTASRLAGMAAKVVVGGDDRRRNR